MNKILSYTKIGGWIAIPLVLWGLPSDFFDHGPAMCLSVLFLNRTCIGCGMTRAVQHLMHGDFSVSWNYNHLVVIVFPVLVYLWVGYARKLWQECNAGH